MPWAILSLHVNGAGVPANPRLGSLFIVLNVYSVRTFYTEVTYDIRVHPVLRDSCSPTSLLALSINSTAGEIHWVYRRESWQTATFLHILSHNKFWVQAVSWRPKNCLLSETAGCLCRHCDYRHPETTSTSAGTNTTSSIASIQKPGCTFPLL